MTDSRPYVTLPEWAEMHRVSIQMAHKLYKAGKLPEAYPSGPQGKTGTILLPRLTPYPKPPRHPDAQEIVEQDGYMLVRGG